ncbi:MAG TPA: pantoate--beta-alanine ligase [Chthonomonas sp.]|uniref:pantoate--beta-alanine ligase n=1 Tax=Chthonomonas sp. TaxID=2282153 RepID=UPI002B4B4CEC|nr:pantoate--beta-alanine ligase [Chthonomonas sp.]HLH79697.1 pantoate--beta-alanine ligase [Chthonomonas sp.]
MRLFHQIAELRTYLHSLRREEKSVGFVPTMGALHEGHLSLFRRAKADCDIAVASIFVNPTQFGPNEDYQSYPRTLQQDLQLATTVGLDAVFAPGVEEMYPAGFQTKVEVENLSRPLEGKHRPGHFAGVATVVTKLLNIVQPDRAYFGQKDYQQAVIIERMVRDLNIPTEIVVLPTVREPDGLALSSRNAYLSAEDRQKATILFRTLLLAQQALCGGERNAEKIRKEMESFLAQEPSAQVDYAAVVHPETLEPLKTIGDQDAILVALAVRIGTTRLIDNMLLTAQGASITPMQLRRGEKS